MAVSPGYFKDTNSFRGTFQFSLNSRRLKAPSAGTVRLHLDETSRPTICSFSMFPELNEKTQLRTKRGASLLFGGHM